MESRRVFQPPPARLVDQYAQAVCQRLSQTVNPTFNTADVQQGFAAFVQTIAAITADHRTRAQDSSGR